MESVFWIVIFPDLETPSGGIKQLHRFAECLRLLNCKVYIVQSSATFRHRWFDSDVPRVSQADWDYGRNLDPNSNVIVLPETFVAQIDQFPPHVPKIIFNQNTAYTFGLPSDDGLMSPQLILSIYQRQDICAICCVSDYDYSVLTEAYGIPADRVFLIRNAIEGDLDLDIDSSFSKSICLMKRKNYRDAIIVQQLLERLPAFSGWSFVRINNMSHHDVLHTLSTSALFLSFGHPEGFGLPVAEAFATGTAVIGYSGLGGKELFNIGKSFGVCWEIQFGDYHGFISAFRQFNRLLIDDQSQVKNRLLNASRMIRNFYSMDEMMASVSRLMQFLM